eukprot:1684758-Pyramimonas_sp.AAC.1
MCARLQLSDGEPERRQCLVLHLVAAVLWHNTEPATAEVKELAAVFRRELWDQATAAAAALGDAPPFVPPREAELRMHCHDAQHAHHDKGLS